MCWSRRVRLIFPTRARRVLQGRAGRVPMASCWAVSDTVPLLADVRPRDAVYTPVIPKGAGHPWHLRPGRADI